MCGQWPITRGWKNKNSRALSRTNAWFADLKAIHTNRRTRLWHLKQSGGMRVVEFVIYIIGATKGRRELTAKRVVTLRAQCVPLIGVVNGTHQPIKYRSAINEYAADLSKGNSYPIDFNGLYGSYWHMRRYPIRWEWAWTLITCVSLSNKAPPFKGGERGESPRHPICGNGLQRPRYIWFISLVEKHPACSRGKVSLKCSSIAWVRKR